MDKLEECKATICKAHSNNRLCEIYYCNLEKRLNNFNATYYQRYNSKLDINKDYETIYSKSKVEIGMFYYLREKYISNGYNNGYL